MVVTYHSWLRNKTIHILTHFKKRSGISKRREKKLEETLIYLLLSSRVLVDAQQALRAWVARQQEKKLRILAA